MQIRDVNNGSAYGDHFDVLISTTGALNNWKWPNIPGLHDFKGKLTHSARWDESYAYTFVVVSFTPEEIETFKKDRQTYQRFRKELELELQSVHGTTILEALTDKKVDTISSNIAKVDADGIITADGAHHPTDLIVCATRFVTTFTPQFPVIGRGGVSLADRWEKTPETYLSMMVEGFPNYFVSLGPNTALGEGNLLLLIEKTIDYFTLCVQKMQRDNIRAISSIDELSSTVIISEITTPIAPKEETKKFPKPDKEAEGVMRANRQVYPCTSMKLRQVKHHILGGSASTQNDDQVPQSDRGSIKFLLNGGTDTFTEHWNLPPSNDRIRGLELHKQRSLEDEDSSMTGFSTKEDYAPAFVVSDPAALSFFQDTFLDFFNGPFGDPHKSLNDTHMAGMTYQPMAPSAQAPIPRSTGQPPSFETEGPFATAIIQAILTRVWSIRIDEKAQEEISADLSFLLAPARMRKFMLLYFKYWHPNCPMIHLPSFDPRNVSLSLLTSVCFIGAMYSENRKELSIAKRLVDFAELFVFSNGIFSCENEITSVFYGTRNVDDEPSCWVQFQNLQAAFLMVICQYWSGSLTSRNRAMENRFGEVIKVARKMGLPKCAHRVEEEHLHEYLWIQRECRIRAINFISLLDCAFSFYQNYPCRLSHTEMECELPCVESMFESQHPFQEPNFQYTRDISLSEAFQSLFEEEGSRATTPSTPGSTVPGILASLTLMDTFMLIHSSSEEWASMGFYKNGYHFWLVSQLLITRKESVDLVMGMEVNCEDKLAQLRVLLQDDNE
ncbi:hypothetical protein BBP40_006597 [Aspergillus hancockii]|nr:hypothetical protein BBP40_006597 [Aspergillus hancockii]